jgi:hypothetical protein
MALGVSSDCSIVPHSPCGNNEMTLPRRNVSMKQKISMLDGEQIGVDGIGSPCCYLAGSG